MWCREDQRLGVRFERWYQKRGLACVQIFALGKRKDVDFFSNSWVRGGGSVPQTEERRHQFLPHHPDYEGNDGGGGTSGESGASEAPFLPPLVPLRTPPRPAAPAFPRVWGRRPFFSFSFLKLVPCTAAATAATAALSTTTTFGDRALLAADWPPANLAGS